MEIEVKQKIRVPLVPYCKDCFRKEFDDKNKRYFCTLFNRFLDLKKYGFLKCRECHMALCDAIEKGE